MTESNQEDLNSQAVPFFARYLEGQTLEDLSQEEMNGIRGGYSYNQLKIDHKWGQIPCEQMVTKKYPSDAGEFVTQKYPSDIDEAVTQKYPSDGDDDLPSDFFQSFK
ncbi:microviridin/marinostatin family tricyclic proteinase inhibitor [Mastigocoleus sp. MO_188.B34]|uniref:microviridin/marinostatin family tricyclic proteinase inhibitor n=1 Tax=Mastigocoleus sp. MO_188.B34 TaxID=3036635 RepID=UPI002633B0A6|nr:microviridin/marinostatin family tricyclic proteinase inhibitor [Mastigocoleus sp. MO_188.B34]MDJ0697508.1 microviridin/marinostatin family tricyclic proteinase inhibitor [Mastigocoleus sp. MO_188.B34]